MLMKKVSQGTSLTPDTPDSDSLWAGLVRPLPEIAGLQGNAEEGRVSRAAHFHVSAWRRPWLQQPGRTLTNVRFFLLPQGRSAGAQLQEPEAQPEPHHPAAAGAGAQGQDGRQR